MNNESTPPPPEDALPLASASEDDISSESAPGQTSSVRGRTLGRAEAQFAKKQEFINSLMKNLDVLVYMELCILYYMDCSLFLFLFRIIPQMTFLTPKPTYAPPLPHSYFSAIYVPNIICLLFHMIGSRPEAGEAMRGYLHGGVIIDLIGYKGPTSKLHLFCLDLVVLAIQCLMLTVQMELKAVTVLLAAFRSNAASRTQPRVQVVSAQDHDAEEQGVIREGILSSGDAEVRALSPRLDGSLSPHEMDADAGRDHALLLEDPPPQDDADQDNILGAMWSGSAIMADFHVISTIQTLWSDHRISFSSDGTLQSMGISAELAALRANRQLNAATQRIQRGVEALGD